ncbi:MAG TPA: hypothetical protein VHF47_00450 [Acidimicrobiales bacterium]|nr:hypothetical protein [Acidimicrobiales bacterium]
MPDKHEFGSPAWVEAVRPVVERLLADHDLKGVEYAFCEEFTDPPDHLRRDGSSAIGWHFRITGGQVLVGDGPLDDADVRIVADYHTVLPLARVVLAEHDDLEGFRRTVEEAAAAGKLRREGNASRVPRFLVAVDFHDPIARLTR